MSTFYRNIARLIYILNLLIVLALLYAVLGKAVL